MYKVDVLQFRPIDFRARDVGRQQRREKIAAGECVTGNIVVELGRVELCRQPEVLQIRKALYRQRLCFGLTKSG